MNTKKKKVLLINPPVTKPCEPHAGLASIRGYLEANGVEGEVFDLNILCIESLLNSGKPGVDRWSQRAVKNCNRHIASLKSFSGYRNLDRYKRAVSDLNRILSLSGGEKFKINLSDFESTELSPVNSRDLVHAAENFRDNPFYQVFHEMLIEKIEDSRPDVIGISFNYLSQGLTGFSIAGFLKQYFSDIPLIAGGGLMTSWKGKGTAVTGFKGLFDKTFFGRGEGQILEYLGIGETVSLNSSVSVYDKKMPYFSKGFVLPILIEDGCYWSRCRFCPERAEGRKFCPADKESFLTSLNRQIQEYSPSLIHFLDNAISPSMIKILAENISGIPWYGFVRFIKELEDIEFCRKLKNSGCVMLQLGLESGSQAVLNGMEKGIRLESASKILKNLHESGIMTFVYILFGTMWEGEEEAQETLTFVSSHADCIDFLNVAVFNLPLDSPDSDHLKKSIFYEGDLALYSDFDHPEGWNRKEIRQFLDKQFKKNPRIAPIIRKTPPVFTSNHAPFFTES